MTPENPAVINIFSEDYGIEQIEIEVKEPVEDLKVTVSKYDSKPSGVSKEKLGKVYSYLRISLENIGENLDKAVVTTKVSASWLSENFLDNEDIAVFKFFEDEDVWKELLTTYVSSDEEYVYYKIELDSFSYFAIGEKEDEDVEEKSAGLSRLNYGWLIGLIIIVLIVLFRTSWKKWFIPNSDDYLRVTRTREERR